MGTTLSLDKTPAGQFDPALIWRRSRSMITLLLHVLRLLPVFCGGHRPLALEKLALRHQLAVHKRTVARPRLRRADGLFWMWLAPVERPHLGKVVPIREVDGLHHCDLRRAA